MAIFEAIIGTFPSVSPNLAQKSRDIMHRLHRSPRRGPCMKNWPLSQVILFPPPSSERASERASDIDPSVAVALYLERKPRLDAVFAVRKN